LPHTPSIAIAAVAAIDIEAAGTAFELKKLCVC